MHLIVVLVVNVAVGVDYDLVALVGVAPAENTLESRFVVMAEPIAASKIGQPTSTSWPLPTSLRLLLLQACFYIVESDNFIAYSPRKEKHFRGL